VIFVAVVAESVMYFSALLLFLLHALWDLRRSAEHTGFVLHRAVSKTIVHLKGNVNKLSAFRVGVLSDHNCIDEDVLPACIPCRRVATEDKTCRCHSIGA
jgi:hypothetical protein